jgi:hypothetical protein
VHVLRDDRRYLPQASMQRLLGGDTAPTLGDLLKEGIAVWAIERLDVE